MASPGASEISQYFDFAEATIPNEQQDLAQDIRATPLGDGYSTQEELQAIPNPERDFNTDFSTHLPRYQKPSHPCDYCRSKCLECFIYDSNGSSQVRCSPCDALFRPCSFSNPERIPAFKQNTALDTLDVVGEDDERCFGGPTGKKQMRSLGHLGPIEDNNQEEERPKKGAAAIRFSRAAVKILKDWMLKNIEHPYPTEADKEMLKEQTGLSVGQVSNWMANTRRRQKARPKRSASPSLRPSTEAINIPAGRTWESLNPFERWKHSPPENEPAPMNAIAQAVETFDPPASASISNSYRNEPSNDSTSSFSIFRAPSISSLETGLTGMSSGSLGSHNSAYSHGSRNSLGSMNSLKSKERRRRRKLPMRTPKLDANDSPRIFQCTFCTDRFKSKYDWLRHEKSLHLSLEKWICAPLGPIIVEDTTGKQKCVYCDELEPSDAHLATHDHGACEEKGLESRTFYRKDHLRQHLRLIHGCKMTPSMETWKAEAQYIKSRCGFCQMSFNNWQDRVDHLAKEFRAGADMKNWKGCRGLEPHVAVHVTNAMPPYLIANESKSPFPFSASNTSSIKQNLLQLTSRDLEYLLPNYFEHCPSNDLCVAYQDDRDVDRIGPIVLTTPRMFADDGSTEANPNATCWEILTLRLGRFAREYIEKHGAGSITDAMLQREARLIVYNVADGWDQTAADNPEWLSLFKKAHGINVEAPTQGIDSQHEVYEDLGLHSNSILDQSFDIKNFNFFDMAEDHPDRSLVMECSLSGSMNVIGNAVRQRSHCRSNNSTPSRSSINSPMLFLSQPPLTGTSPMASLNVQGTPGGESVVESPDFGLLSFSLPDENTSQADNPFSMPAIPENFGNEVHRQLMPGTSDLQFPSWDQLPPEFQNPASSVDLSSTIPINMTDFNMPNVESSTIDPMTWDTEDMNFMMDMDMDLDMENPNMLNNS